MYFPEIGSLHHPHSTINLDTIASATYVINSNIIHSEDPKVNNFVANGNPSFEMMTYFICTKCFNFAVDIAEKILIDKTLITAVNYCKACNYVFEFTRVFSSKRKSVLTLPFMSNISRLYIHNQNNKGIFDNTTITNVDAGQTETAIPFPFYIVPVFGFGKTMGEVISVNWINETIISGISRDLAINIPQITADKIHIFNDSQSTDITTLVSFEDIMANYFTYNVRLIKGIWHYNDIKDMLSEASYNSGVPFITKFSVLDTSKIDTNKPFYNQRPLIGQWVAIKLIFNNTIVDNNSKEFRILQVGISILPTTR